MKLLESCLIQPGRSDNVWPVWRVFYTNHRGERRLRTIQVTDVWYGKTEWHPNPLQWFVDGFDVLEDGTLGPLRSFALADMDAELPEHSLPGQPRRPA